MVGEAIGKLIVDKVRGVLQTAGQAADTSGSGSQQYTGSFGSMPNTNEHVGAADSEVSAAQNDLRENYDAATSRTDDIRNEATAVPGEDLYSDVNHDFAESDKGDKTLNRRSFEHTLSLSRQADAYNSMPRLTSIRTTNGQGGMTSIDTGLDKPKLETQEMRQMRANERLSERQRQLRQNIQNLVERKNYDLFVAWYQQKFGLNLSLTQAEQAVISFNRTQQISNIINMHHEWFREKLRVYVGAQIADYITTKASQGDFIWSSYFFGAYGLSLRPGQLADYYEEKLNQEIYDLANKSGVDPELLKNNILNARNSIQRTGSVSDYLK